MKDKLPQRTDAPLLTALGGWFTGIHWLKGARQALVWSRGEFSNQLRREPAEIKTIKFTSAKTRRHGTLYPKSRSLESTRFRHLFCAVPNNRAKASVSFTVILA
ncbi:MAG: hypothetical protein ABSA47_20120, partial [Verrucomicrobiota bacterium]